MCGWYIYNFAIYTAVYLPATNGVVAFDKVVSNL